MQFANPIWLWGLTGLMVPLAIHLLSRRESHVIKLGSLRHLQESHTKQSINVRLNEVALLALRCLLIILLVLIVSGLRFNPWKSKQESWLVVESGLENDKAFAMLRDSLTDAGYLSKQLAPGFPALGDGAEDKSVDYWNMIKVLARQPLQHAVVLSNSFAEGYSGHRIPKPDWITWIAKNPSDISLPIRAVAFTSDSVHIRLEHSSPIGTSFEDITQAITAQQSAVTFPETQQTIPIDWPDTLDITCISDAEFVDDKNIFIASIQALAEATDIVLTITDQRPDDWKAESNPDWIVWLTNTTFTGPPKINQIVFSEQATSNPPLFTPQPSGGFSKRWTLNRHINTEIALQEKLALQLARILLPGKDTAIRVRDHRMLSEAMMWSPNAEVNKNSVIGSHQAHTDRWLAFLFLISFVFERLLAFKRKQ